VSRKKARRSRNRRQPEMTFADMFVTLLATTELASSDILGEPDAHTSVPTFAMFSMALGSARPGRAQDILVQAGYPETVLGKLLSEPTGLEELAEGPLEGHELENLADVWIELFENKLEETSQPYPPLDEYFHFVFPFALSSGARSPAACKKLCDAYTEHHVPGEDALEQPIPEDITELLGGARFTFDDIKTAMGELVEHFEADVGPIKSRAAG